MSDLIDRQAAIYAVGLNTWAGSRISGLPTIDAEPVEHGEWKPEITVLGTMIFRCSACQKFSDIHWAYCPQCGAKMDGERKEDAKTD